jgi:hypothetical protein
MGRRPGSLNKKTIEKLKKEGKPVPAQVAKKVSAKATNTEEVESPVEEPTEETKE